MFPKITMEENKEHETKIKYQKLAKTVSVLAKINISLGLLMLLASVGSFVFINDANDAVDKVVRNKLNYYRHGKISEEDYESKLKQSTFFRLYIHYGWRMGLAYSLFLMVTNVLLLIALVWNRHGLFCCWMKLTLLFDLFMIFAATAVFVLGALLLDTLSAALFFVTSVLLLGLPTIPLCCLVYKLIKKKNVEEKEQIFNKDHYKICLDGGGASNIVKPEVLI